MLEKDFTLIRGLDSNGMRAMCWRRTLHSSEDWIVMECVPCAGEGHYIHPRAGE